MSGDDISVLVLPYVQAGIVAATDRDGRAMKQVLLDLAERGDEWVFTAFCRWCQVFEHLMGLTDRDANELVTYGLSATDRDGNPCLDEDPPPGSFLAIQFLMAFLNNDDDQLWATWATLDTIDDPDVTTGFVSTIMGLVATAVSDRTGAVTWT